MTSCPVGHYGDFPSAFFGYIDHPQHPPLLAVRPFAVRYTFAFIIQPPFVFVPVMSKTVAGRNRKMMAAASDRNLKTVAVRNIKTMISHEIEISWESASTAVVYARIVVVSSKPLQIAQREHFFLRELRHKGGCCFEWAVYDQRAFYMGIWALYNPKPPKCAYLPG